MSGYWGGEWGEIRGVGGRGCERVGGGFKAGDGRMKKGDGERRGKRGQR